MRVPTVLKQAMLAGRPGARTRWINPGRQARASPASIAVRYEAEVREERCCRKWSRWIFGPANGLPQAMFSRGLVPLLGVALVILGIYDMIASLSQIHCQAVRNQFCDQPVDYANSYFDAYEPPNYSEVDGYCYEGGSFGDAHETFYSFSDPHCTGTHPCPNANPPNPPANPNLASNWCGYDCAAALEDSTFGCLEGFFFASTTTRYFTGDNVPVSGYPTKLFFLALLWIILGVGMPPTLPHPCRHHPPAHTIKDPPIEPS